MARNPRHSALLGARQQSTGMLQLVICCVLSLVLLTVYTRESENGPIHTVRGAVSVVTMPARLLGSAIATPFDALGNAVSNITASPETLSDLEKENAKLTAQVAELTESAATAERLEGLLDLQSTYSLQSTAARIIGETGDAWSRSVTIDKGTTSGFEVGMPVCNSTGVIGQIIEVSATTSTVRLITDEQSSISAMVQSSRAQGMLQGQSDGTLRLAYVSADAEVSEGDIIITSGLGGIFPKGLPLGVVSSAEKASNATYYTIVVRATSEAENNEEVLVITSLTDEQVASDEDVASANTSPEGDDDEKDSTSFAEQTEEGE